MKKLILLGAMALGAANVQAQWSLTGNAGTNPAINFIGTTDNQNVIFKRNNVRAGLLDDAKKSTSFGVGALHPSSTGSNNSAFGYNALFSNMTTNPVNSGSGNTAVGTNALYSNSTGAANVAIGEFALYSNVTGGSNVAIGSSALYYNTNSFNTACGFAALWKNTTGSGNTGTGVQALSANTTGSNNTATGSNALGFSTTGSDNTANGSYALQNNKTGYDNIAIGKNALYSNNVGAQNTATGNSALYSNTSGGANTANGYLSLYSNSSGNLNTATGYSTLYNNTTGYNNSAFGSQSLQANTTGNENSGFGEWSLLGNTTGSQNVGVGERTLQNNQTGSRNTAVGSWSLFNNNASGDMNTAIGYNSGPSAFAYFSNTTALGYNTQPTISNQVILGNTSVTSILGYNNITITSDGRFKNNIQENVPGLEFINQLKPVTYNYKIHDLNNYIGIKKTNEERNKNLNSIEEVAIAAKEKIVYTGFVAQDVEKAADKVGYNFSGIHKPQNEKDPYGLSYAEFVPPLVKAVQELSAKNEEKQTEIQQLNDKLKALEQKLDALINNHSGTTELNNNTTIVLDQNAPNPFAESTTINYSIDSDFSAALISISNNNGVVIKTYPITAKGKSQLTVYGSNLSSGVYRYTLIVDGKTIETKTMIKN